MTRADRSGSPAPHLTHGSQNDLAYLDIARTATAHNFFSKTLDAVGPAPDRLRASVALGPPRGKQLP